VGILDMIAQGSAPDLIGGLNAGISMRNNLLANQAMKAQIAGQQASSQLSQQKQLEMVNKQRAQDYFKDMSAAMYYSFDDENVAKQMIQIAMSKLDPSTDEIYLRGSQQLLQMSGDKFKKTLLKAVDHGAQMGYVEVKKSLTDVANDLKLKERETRVKELTAETGAWKAQAENRRGYDKMAQDRELSGMNYQLRSELNALERQKFENELQQKQIEQKYGKIPPGYRRTQSGTLEAIPGSKPAMEQQAAEEKRTQSISSIMDKKATIDDAVEQLLGNREKGIPGLVTDQNTGRTGRIWAATGDPEMVELQGALDVLTSNLAFDELAKMKQLSPTGGALGSVAVEELRQLQRTIAALDYRMGAKKLRSNILKIQKHYNKWAEAVTEANKRYKDRKISTMSDSELEQIANGEQP
jgi:hypothetical protein